jgi:hypothetical protein
LGEFLCLAHFAEAVADNHGGIVSVRGGEGKPGARWHCSCFHSAAVGWQCANLNSCPGALYEIVRA